MFDFYKINFEAKIRQNIGQICKTIKKKDMSCLVTMKEAYSEDVSSRVSSSFTILTQYQSKYCWSKLWYKNYEKNTCDVNNRKVAIMPSTLLLLNLFMLMYIFSRIPGKHKSTRKFFIKFR